MEDPKRILIIRPSALGDVARSVPLAAALAGWWPDARIDWLVNAPYADVVRAHPAISDVIPFDRKGMGASTRKFDTGPLRAFLRDLRSRRYDLVIEAQGLFRSGVFAWATRAQARIGFADAREFGWLGVNRRVHVDPSLHTVDRMLALLGPLEINTSRPDMRLYAPPEAQDIIQQDSQLAPPFVVIAPTSLWPGKRWPIGRHAEIASRLRQKNMGVVVIGAPGEREQCEPLLEIPGVIDRVGSTTVGEMMAIIERSKAVIASDSAALHIAVGFDRPTVALFGPTDTRKVGPYQRDHEVIQHITPGDTLDHKNEMIGRELMERITTDEVWARLSALI